ncbi:MAG TPA: hypothetical protein VK631_01270 [Solirubrobacteraceae bacterium]|nr:hypothetical protein [Solirubrobacteraceae bacterium]
MALCCLAAPAAARASTAQESLVEDERQMLQSGPVARAAALDDVVALGADGVRAVVRWRDVAPAPDAARPPAGFEPADPASYPAARWDPVDDLVRGTAARGLALLLSPSAPIPSWASRCAGSAALRRLCTPDPGRYGAFLRALGRRYSGAYADENEGGGILPRVGRWSFGNEPNQATWLLPQFAVRGGRTYSAAAVAYRAMVRAGIAALRSTGHRGDQMLLGETSPIGRRTGALARRSTPPATFIRTLLCIDARGRALRGKAAAIRGCAGFKRLPVTGFAHHPYAQGGSKPPAFRGDPATEITLASSRRLERLLDAGAARGRIPAALPIHYTEHGFQSSPPDATFGVSLARQAAYVNQADWIAYRDPRVRTVAQYKLIDDPIVSSFQSGVRFVDGRPKPAYGAYRLPLWVARKGPARLRVYGQVRPLAPGATARVELQNAPLAGGAFTTVARLTVRSANNAFLRTVPRFEGRFRLRWTPPDGGAPLLSREARIANR